MANLTRVQEALVKICEFNHLLSDGRGSYENEFYKIAKRVCVDGKRYYAEEYTIDKILLEDIIIAMDYYCEQNKEYRKKVLKEVPEMLTMYISSIAFLALQGTKKRYSMAQMNEYYAIKENLDILFDKTKSLKYLNFHTIFNPNNPLKGHLDYCSNVPFLAYICLANDNDIKSFEKIVDRIFCRCRYGMETVIKKFVEFHEICKHNEEFKHKLYELLLKNMIPIAGPTRKAAFVGVYSCYSAASKDLYYDILVDMDNVANTWDNKDYGKTSSKILAYINKTRAEKILY